MEKWKAIPGHEGGYEVSDYGRVRSLDRTVMRKDGRSFQCHGKLLTPKPNVGGYPSLRLGRGFPVMVHQLVTLAFLGPAEGRYTCHNNNDRKDNRLTNLRYDTAYGNQADRTEHGTRMYGSMLPQAILNEDQVRDIKRVLGQISHKELGRRYGVCAGTISAISRGLNWKQVTI